jgi:hypothetical protein
VIVIQSIITEWGKGARGGAGAARRNATPEALLLKEPPKWEPSGNGLHHQVFVTGYGNFTKVHTTEKVENIDVSRTFNVGCVHLILDEGTLKAMYQYTGNCAGMPQRGTFIPYEASVLQSAGEWGQFIYNGRYVYWNTGGWHYQKHVINIGLVASFVSDLFLACPPLYQHHDLAILA